MRIDTENFHVFFPRGCYRKKLTPRREEIFVALDSIIQSEGFDLDLFDTTKQAYLDAMNSAQERETFTKLNTLIAPLFLLLVDQGFSEKELQNYEAVV
jgi:hypothetical protein